jgi:hypothetical protein
MTKVGEAMQIGLELGTAQATLIGEDLREKDNLEWGRPGAVPSCPMTN